MRRSPRASSLATTPVAAAALAGLALLASSPAAAQDDGHVPRSGFWLSGGLGGGINEDGNGGGAAYVRLGGTLGPSLLLGGEVAGLGRETTATVRRGDVIEEEEADVTRSNVTASLLYYPSEQGDFYLKGGLGFATLQVSVEQGDVTVSTDETGVGLTLGAGHDVQLGDGNLFLTPNVDVLLQSYDGLGAPDGLFLLTLGIGFR